ncbi:Methylthioribose-1-phosphate isomerase [Sporotomaculum syntrophicum]|uniref:Methylthioribose-1-phosphate isomerase n=2 Tax=Sporotomaculum syntrophicum TaxID=182264 RepID=A0A9D2WRS0_9FIRM|nr:Methylthioribose-1-phosphate isomerase [Sporotomaculum syntrophicum]
MKPLLDDIDAIITNRTSGASELAVQALQALAKSVKTSQAATPELFTSELQEVIAALAKCRPTMATIYNAVHRFQQQLQTCVELSSTLPELQNYCMKALDQLKKDVIVNKKQSIINAANFINTGTTIATCSYSSTLVDAIHNAVLQGKTMLLLVMKSQAGAISYGEQSRLRFAADGLNCRVIPDDILPDSLDGVDLVLLGADTVFKDGSVLNGYPSLKLAETAAVHNPTVPVYVICDSLKFSLDRRLDKIEEGFEAIPFKFITGLISEDGVFKKEKMLDYLSSRAIYS